MQWSSSSCDATLVTWHKGVDSNVWVVNGFPFPVKAETFADVTTPPAPIQVSQVWGLLETGTGAATGSNRNGPAFWTST